MAEITHDRLNVCEDCAEVIANGDGPDGQAARIVAQWGDLATGLVLACSGDEDSEDSCDTFNRWPCDGCGSPLAGSRHAAVVLS